MIQPFHNTLIHVDKLIKERADKEKEALRVSKELNDTVSRANNTLTVHLGISRVAADIEKLQGGFESITTRYTLGTAGISVTAERCVLTNTTTEAYITVTCGGEPALRQTITPEKADCLHSVVDLLMRMEPDLFTQCRAAALKKQPKLTTEWADV